MKRALAFYLMAGCLGAPVWAHQAQPDPAVKTGDGRAAPAKKSSASACSNMAGGTEASGGENVETQAKTGKAKTAGCGQHNGKASAPHAAPTTPNPDVKSRS
jgi:hypothetical protein